MQPQLDRRVALERLPEGLVDPVGDAVDRLADFFDVIEGIGGVGEQTEGSLFDVGAAFGLIGDELTRSRAGFLDVAGAAELTEAALQALALVADPAGKAIDKSGTAAEKLGDTAAEAAPEVENLVDAVETSGDVSTDAEGDVVDFQMGLLGVASAALDALSAVVNYNKELKAQADPAFAAARAVGQLRDAQSDLTDVQADSEASANDIAEAQLAVAEALFDAQLALDDLNAAGAKDAIGSISTALGISEQAAQDLLTQLGVLDGTKVSTVIETQFTTRGNFGGGSQFTPKGTEIPIGARAMGGPVSASTPYVVGERGPELFVPNVGGNIVPNDQIGGGSEVHVTINNPTAQNVEDDTRRGLQYAALLGMV